MSTANLSPHLKSLGQLDNGSCGAERVGLEMGHPGTGAKNQSNQGKNPGPLPRVTGGPLPCLGGPAGEACGPEGRGEQPEPLHHLTSPLAIPRLEELAHPHLTQYAWGVEESSPCRILQALSDTDNLSWGGRTDIPSVMEDGGWGIRTLAAGEGPRGQSKIQGAEPPRHHSSQGPMGVMGSPEALGLSEEDNMERVIGPKQGHMRGKNHPHWDGKNVPNTEATPWPCQFRPGTVALREICRYQKITDAPRSQITLPEACLGDLLSILGWTYSSKGITIGSPAGDCRGIPHRLISRTLTYAPSMQSDLQFFLRGMQLAHRIHGSEAPKLAM